MLLLQWVIIVTSPKSFCYGLGLTLTVTVVSFAIAHWGFGNLYYLAQLLPVFMTLCVLLAWLLYLRKTGFLALNPNSKNKPAQTTMGHFESAETKDLPEDKVSGAELILVRDENGLVRRRPRDPGPIKESPKSVLENPIPVLLWSAVQIAVLSVFLYEVYGIGSKFHT